MGIRGLAWVTGITLAACSAGEVRAPAALPSAPGAASIRVGDATAASATAASALSVPPAPSGAAFAADTLPHADRVAPLPADADSLAGPVLPPEVVSMMTYDQYHLTLDPHGPGISAFETSRGDSADLVLGSPSVVDDPAPPADIELE